MFDQTTTTGTPDPRFRRLHDLGQLIGVHYAINRGLYGHGRPRAMAGAVAFVLRFKLAKFLAAKAAPYQNHGRR